MPHLESVDAEFLADGRLLLRIKDAPFDEPILARFASDGTLKMLSYLTVLYDPNPPQLVGIEEPENHLHPRLLAELAEECRAASERTQLMVSTHSPFFVNGLRPQETWILYRDERGFTQARAVRRLASEGRSPSSFKKARSGDLWAEGYLVLVTRSSALGL